MRRRPSPSTRPPGVAEACRSLWGPGPTRSSRRSERAGSGVAGGAGFPTGEKWRSVRSTGAGTRFAVCNGAEGEPATFKDRVLLRTNPYQALEGLAIAAYAVGAERAYLGVKEIFAAEVAAVRRALEEMESADALGGPDRGRDRTGPVPVRRGDRARGGDRRPPAAAPNGPALHPGPVREASGRQPDARQQRGDAVERPTHPGRRPRLAPGQRHGDLPGDHGLHRLRGRPAGGRVRAPYGYAAAAPDRGPRGRPTGRPPGEGRVPGSLEHGHRPAGARHTHGLRLDAPGRDRTGCRWFRRLRRLGVHGPGGLDVLPISLRGVLRPVPSVQVRDGRSHQGAGGDRGGERDRTRTSRSPWSGPEARPTARSARCPPGRACWSRA